AYSRASAVLPNSSCIVATFASVSTSVGPRNSQRLNDARAISRCFDRSTSSVASLGGRGSLRKVFATLRCTLPSALHFAHSSCCIALTPHHVALSDFALRIFFKAASISLVIFSTSVIHSLIRGQS